MGNTHSTQPSQQVAVYSADERQLLLGLARRGLLERARGGSLEPDPAGLPANLLGARACFVTLFHRGELRGCIGHVHPKIPLFQAVVQNACAAGFHDMRFAPVEVGEVRRLTIEISVLTLAAPLNCGPEEILPKLRPGIDGVLLKKNGQVVTFLPQVWEKLPDREQFMSRLCQKAGWARDDWKNPLTTVSVYQTESFEGHPEN